MDYNKEYKYLYYKYKNKYINLKNLSMNYSLNGSGVGASCHFTVDVIERGAAGVLDKIIVKIEANSLTKIAQGANGDVYKDTIDDTIYIVKVMDAEPQGKMEVEQYTLMKDAISKCKTFGLLANKTIGKKLYALYYYGGESLISWLGKNVSVDYIPILLQVINQLKCFTANNSSHLDVKAENIIVNKVTGTCTDCPICGGCEVKAGESVTANLIDLTSLVKLEHLIGATGKKSPLTLGTNDAVEHSLFKFSSADLNYSKLHLSGIAHTFLTCVLNNSPNTFETYKQVTGLGPAIMMKMLEEMTSLRDDLTKLGYGRTCNRNACDFPLTTLGMWLSHEPITLGAITTYKPEYKKDDLIGMIKKAAPLFRFALCDYLIKTFASVFTNKTKASHVVHILSKCYHIDESQRYTYDELIEELYRFGKAYNGGKYTGCSGTVSPKLFDATKNDYSVMPK